MLALFDSPGPSALYKLGDRPEFEFAGMMTFLSQALSSMFGAEIDVPVEELRKIPREQQLDYLIERCVKTTGDADLGESREALERIIDIFELTDKGERQFVPQRYHGRVHLYRVQEMADYEFTAYKNHPRISAASFGWDELVDDLQIRFVPGTHMSMIFPPNTEVLMTKFAEDLRAAEAGCASAAPAEAVEA
jgi:thioesterase domain-containing protein